MFNIYSKVLDLESLLQFLNYRFGSCNINNVFEEDLRATEALHEIVYIKEELGEKEEDLVDEQGFEENLEQQCADYSEEQSFAEYSEELNFEDDLEEHNGEEEEAEVEYSDLSSTDSDDYSNLAFLSVLDALDSIDDLEDMGLI